MKEALPELDESKLENEIAELESRLAKAKQKLNSKKGRTITTTTTTAAEVADSIPRRRRTPSTSSASSSSSVSPSPSSSYHITPTIPDSAHHYLLLLSDSALPLGSFAFSSGLESYLAHARSPSSSSSPSLSYRPSFASFLPLSVHSYASTTLPFVLAAHRTPTAVSALDDALDAAIVCAVGRRASTAQGRALLSIWEKSLAPSLSSSSSSSSSSSAGTGAGDGDARRALEVFSADLRVASRGQKTAGVDVGADADADVLPPSPSAHLAPLFGAVARLLGLTLRQAAYAFLLGHAKALVSAAVRAGVFGPYQAQTVLAGGGLRALLADAVARAWDVPVEEAGQSVPVMDLWVGRHEMLYSRIFNS